MLAQGQTRSFGDVGPMSDFLESGHAWAIYEYTPLGFLLDPCRVAHLRARADRLKGDRDVGPARTALRADRSVDELGNGELLAVALRDRFEVDASPVQALPVLAMDPQAMAMRIVPPMVPTWLG